MGAVPYWPNGHFRETLRVRPAVAEPAVSGVEYRPDGATNAGLLGTA